MKPCILEQVASGEEGAMAALMDAYGGLVWSLATRFCRDRSEAEDASQDILLSVWESAKRYDADKASEATFVAMIARRRLIDRQRRVRREIASETIEASVEAKDRLSDSEDLARVSEEIEKLPPEQREVLRLSIVENLTHDEIAEATGRPLGTVKSQIRRSLLKVRDAMTKGGVA
ncbi:MAG: sigma-70 family RNA polymerase sigma factor [Phycisphaerales bacterium]|nr:sigma-70 family RNA polymerase sigma factor [Phycisphaerales bacterium]